jgi:hypothetical protein
VSTIPTSVADTPVQTAAVSLHIVQKADLRSPQFGERWEDPHRIAALTPQKRQALLDNPLSYRDDDPVQIIALRKSRVVGHIEVFAGSVEIEGSEPVPTLWTSNFYVPEEYRATLAGVMLILKLQALSPTVAACAVSQMALPVFEKMRWTKFILPRYLLLRRSRSVVERFFGENFAAHLMASALDLGLATQRMFMRAVDAPIFRRFRIEPIERMSEDLDPLLRAQAKAGPHRSSAWINWLLTHSLGDDEVVGNRRRLFYVYERGGNTLLGYFLLRLKLYETASHRGFRNVMLGTLADWMSFEPAKLDLRGIISLSVRELSRWNADVIEICTSEPAIGRSLRRRGLLRVGELAILIKPGPKTPLGGPSYREQANWRLTPAEGDNFLA